MNIADSSSPNLANANVGSSFSTSEIQKMVCKMEVLRYNIPAENIKYLMSDWELDVISINKNDYLTEYEVKISRSDFKADSKKKKWKHYADTNEFVKSANYFYYVCPNGLILESEMPKFAGLIYATEFGLKVVKKAPIIHKHKHNRNKILSKILAVVSERKYLGSCRMTYKNNKLRRS